MGNSDNVVRAGLTPKLKDVDTLLDILEFQPQSPDETKLVPTTTDDDPWVSIYNPPVDDFSVKKIQVSKTKQSKKQDKTAFLTLLTYNWCSKFCK